MVQFPAIPRNVAATRALSTLTAACAIVALAGVPVNAQDTAPPRESSKPVDLAAQSTLFLVGYSHLDTEWNWAYPESIRDYLPATLHENFALFKKYPDYTFNWTGANRYRLMKEYYPDDYATMKSYVAAGRWFPAGSSLEEADANIPSPESIIRQVLYGNEYFRREFGMASNEYMLPDCFGFPASLPSILAHAGITGFSTQKLTKSPKPFIPFNVGNWIGTDGSSVIAELNAGSYHTQLREDLTNSKTWADRLAADGGTSGIHADYAYYGVGDTGGAPDEESVQWLEKSLSGKGPVRVVSARGSDMFSQISQLPPAVSAKLPSYSGDLLLTQHSAGTATSEAMMKRWNRKNELLGDSAERASVAATLLGSGTYPMAQLTDAWMRFLPAQCHDIIAGTCSPECYNLSWNDEIVSLNEFADVLSHSVGEVARGLDTRGAGVPVVVYNPLSIEREDVVEAVVALTPPPLQAGGHDSSGISVIGPDGKPVPCQLIGVENGRTKIAFLARVPSIGFATFHARLIPVPTKPVASELKVTTNSLENARYRVSVDANGDVSSIYDKAAKREILSAPIRLAFQSERPVQYPAWNMDWADAQKPPRSYVDGRGAQQTPPGYGGGVTIVEDGPARVALKVVRSAEGSLFRQTIRLSAGATGNRVEFSDVIDWRSNTAALKAVFPLTVANPSATYNWGVGTVQRTNNHPESYEAPSHDWFDLTAPDSSYGVSILNEAKYGSDKPDDSTLRLTLLYTPGLHNSYMQMGSQDWGRHEINYALEGHSGDWRQGKSQDEAARFNQPIVAFQTTAHPGALGKTFSLLHVSSAQVQVATLKKAEDSDEIVVRLFEMNGQAAKNVRLSLAAPIAGVREVNGQEQPTAAGGDTPTIDNGVLVFDMAAYRPRAFALKLGKPAAAVAPTGAGTPITLPFDTNVISAFGATTTETGFDGEGRTLPAEMLPPHIESDGVMFAMSGATAGSNNAVSCNGQSIALPASSGGVRRIYLLAAATGGDTDAVFQVDGVPTTRTIENWDGFIGQWDTRVWQPGDGTPTVTALTPGYIKRAPIAWYSDHVRLKDGKNDPYHFCYLFRYAIDIPAGAKALTLPVNPKVRVFAVTVAANPGDDTRPASPLYDTLADHTSAATRLVL